MADNDVFKILADLEVKAVGLDPQTKTMQEGYFIAFRNSGLPLPAEDYSNPFSPTGAELKKINADQPHTDPKDPKDAGKATGSDQTGDDKAAVAGIAQSMQNYMNTFGLSDLKLQLSNTYSAQVTGTRVSDSWFAIVTGATIGKPPTIPPDLQQTIDAATAVLVDGNGDPTPHLTAYNTYRDAYNHAVRERNKAYASAFTNPDLLAQWPIDGLEYEDAISNAFSDWSGLGHKVEIETAKDTLASIGEDPAVALIARSKAKFTNVQVTPAPNIVLPYVSMEPPSWWDDTSDDGWTNYTSTDVKSTESYTSSSTSFGGTAGIHLGLWSASAGLDNTKTQTSMNHDTSDMQVEFSYCIVDIVRWSVDTSLVNLKSWYLMGNYSKDCISNGTMKQEFPDENSGLEPVFLPSLVTSLVLIKNLKLTWSHWTEAQSDLESGINANGSVGYGPFSIGGKYSHHAKSHSLSYSLDGETLTVDGMQLIGYVSAIMPASPGLDSPKPATASASHRRSPDWQIGRFAAPLGVGPQLATRK